MARGGRRAGRQGQAYSNRTDLANAANQKPVAPSAPTGMPYGAHQAMIEAQKVVPIAPPPTASPAPGPPVQPPAGPLPGELTPLNAPSQRVNEPVTAGLPIGDGPGPVPNGGDLSSMLDRLSMSGAPADVAFLADWVRQGSR